MEKERVQLCSDVAHVMAKSTAFLNFVLICNKGSLPPSI